MGSQSAHKTTHYEKLAQEPSDEEVEDDVVFLQEGATFHRNGFAPEEIRNHIPGADEAVLTGLLQKGSVSSKRPVGTDFIEVKMARLKCCRQLLSRRLVALALFGVLIALAVALITIIMSSYRFPLLSKPTAEWAKEYNGLSSESCIRLFDVNEDGKLDIIFSVGRLQNLTIPQLFEGNGSQHAMDEICKRLGDNYPCLGEIIALRGNDSVLLWSLRVHMQLFEINCGNVDINKDGKPDCIGTGRFGTVVAFDPRTGTLLWRAVSDSFMGVWSSFGVLLLPDFTGDGVPELLLPHSSDPRFTERWAPTSQKEKVRYTGRLFMLDGATGKTMGRYMPVPENHETYLSPVLHALADGSQYVIFGHGGETIPGSLLMISVPDFYRYVMQLADASPVPATAGQYNQWKSLPLLTDNKFVHEIYRSKTAGVMVPPVCVDVNKDGTRDLLMLSYDGNCTLYDGLSLAILWTRDFHGLQSYSTPAPGYFNDDDVLDFMIHLNLGFWPSYNYSMVVVLDGKNGSTIWSLQSSEKEMSSALVARTNQAYHDVFVFRVGGLLNLNSDLPRTRVKRESVLSRPARQIALRRNRPVQQQTRRYPFSQPRRFRPGNLRVPAEDDVYFNYRLPGLDGAEPMHSRSGIDYDNSAGYPADGDPNYDFGDGDINGASPYSNNKYQEADRERPRNEEQLENIASVTQQPSPVIASSEAMPAATTTMKTMMIPPVCNPDSLHSLAITQFVVDRNTVTSPLRIFQDAPIAINYTVVESDQRRRRRRRHEEHSATEQKTHSTNMQGCSYLIPDELTTGSLGDVDGDGTLDLVSIVSSSAIIRDQFDRFVRSEKRVKVSKYNLELDMVHASLQNFVRLDTSAKSVYTTKSFGRLRPTVMQPWGAYLGTQGDSVYREIEN